jgi:hypothetical protein
MILQPSAHYIVRSPAFNFTLAEGIYLYRNLSPETLRKSWEICLLSCLGLNKPTLAMSIPILMMCCEYTYRNLNSVFFF